MEIDQLMVGLPDAPLPPRQHPIPTDLGPLLPSATTAPSPVLLPRCWQGESSGSSPAIGVTGLDLPRMANGFTLPHWWAAPGSGLHHPFPFFGEGFLVYLFSRTAVDVPMVSMNKRKLILFLDLSGLK